VGLLVPRSLPNISKLVTRSSALFGLLLKGITSKSSSRATARTLRVGDVARPGAFDVAVKGMDAIAHTAAPFHVRDTYTPLVIVCSLLSCQYPQFNSTNPDDLWVPARQGTVELLESAAKAQVLSLAPCLQLHF
jgi:nucleoside-diphosphate-sugar epimerase